MAGGAALSGCTVEEACTLEMRSSVTVRVIDEGGEADPAASVRYRIDGGTWEQAECMPAAGTLPDGTPRCQGWTAGWEDVGEFHIEASSSDGQRVAQATVLVEDGECHVKSETVMLTLE
jgi:hypothetical protein